MKKSERYMAAFIKQIKRFMVLIKSPSEIVREENKKDCINFPAIGLNIAVLMLMKWQSLLDFSLVVMRIKGWVTSVALLTVYLIFTILVGKGQVRLKRVINLALYTHVIYIFINASVGHGYIHVLTYVMGHIYTVCLQILALKDLFDCKIERVKLIFYVEVGILILGFINQMMFYVGQQIIYSSKLFHFPLLG